MECKCNLLFFLFALFVVSAKCVNFSILRVTSPVYGLTSAVDQNDSACFRDLEQFKDALVAGHVWALKVLDASGKAPVGFIYGNNLWIGSHTQCMDIQNRKQFEIRLEKVNHTVTPFDYPPYDLVFAMIRMRHNSTLQYHMRLPLDYVVQLGLCVPKSCSDKDIFNLSQIYFTNNTLQFQQDYQVSLEVSHVRILEEGGLWMLMLPKTIIFLAIVTVIFVLTIFGTVLDVKQHNREKNVIRGHNNNAIGIKDVSEEGSWVIIVHTSFFQGDFIQNPPYAWRLAENFAAQIVSNSTYSVDTYLFLSGFLLAYIFFKSINPHEAMKAPLSYTTSFMKLIHMYSNRFLRLTPTYVIVILLCDLIYTFYGRTSSLYFSERSDVVCDNYWWRNILYINNLYPRSEMCLSWSWYLSVDMQFFIVGALLLVISTMYFSIAASMVVLIILVQITATAYKSYSIGYIPTLDDQLEQLDAIYDLPWNRIGPYMVGMITAYVLVVKLKSKLVLKERTRLTLWVLFPLLNLWILFTLYTRQVSVGFSAVYMGISRPLWGVGIAWFVVAVSTGNARLLEKLLSYGAWVPLGRLTYCAYLLNPLVVSMISLGSESGIVSSIPEMAITANGTIMTTMMMSFLFSMVFESPFILMTNVLLKKATQNPKKSIDEDRINHNNAQNGTSSTINTMA